MSNVRDVKANPFEAVKITLADGGQYELKFNLNALAELEDKYQSVDKAFKAMQEGSFKAIRCVLWAGLLYSHPDWTEQTVGSLMDMETMQDMVSQLGKAADQDLPTTQQIQETPAVPNV